MNIVYKMSFIERIKNKTPPYYYIGSKTNCWFNGHQIVETKTGKYYWSFNS